MKALLEKLHAVRQTAERPVDGDFRTRPGREAQQRQAKAELPTITKQVGDAFKKVGFPVFVAGPGASEFLDVANDMTEVIAVDFDATFSEIRSAVKASLGSQSEFTPTGYHTLLRELRGLGNKLNLTSIDVPGYDGAESFQNENEFNGIVNKYMNKVGAGFVANLLENEALSIVTTLKGENPTVPVLLFGVPADLRAEIGSKLYGGQYVEVTAQKGVTEENVTAAFKGIKKLLKQK